MGLEEIKLFIMKGDGFIQIVLGIIQRWGTDCGVNITYLHLFNMLWFAFR